MFSAYHLTLKLVWQEYELSVLDTLQTIKTNYLLFIITYFIIIVTDQSYH